METSLPPVRRRRLVRDALLVLLPCVLLASLMAFRGDVTHPHGDDPLHPLGHFASLWHAGHVPGGVFAGLACVVLAALGVLGLLGDSPLDLQGDEIDPPRVQRPWYAREGTWLLASCALLYLPRAGAYGLWDPWETHYAEVAREVLARDDWITLWWGQEGWFLSKPVLVFWMSALGMDAGATFGLSFFSGLSPGAHEWCVRLPIALASIAAVYALYRAVARAFGPRAGLCVGLVLATSPQWFFLAHQGMTDMPFVAPLVCAMACLMVALTTDPATMVTAQRVRLPGRTLRVSRWHLVVGAIVLVALPQASYLATRPLTFACGDGETACIAALAASRVGPVQFPIERFASGSAVNSVPDDVTASVPGSPAWESHFERVPFASGPAQAIVWLALAVLLLRSLRHERGAQPLAFAGVYLFGALSFLGKGPAGLGVPEAVIAGFVLVTGRVALLRRIRLVQGAAIFALCGLPWYVAIACRLGDEWFDRFVVNDLLNRAFAGVHGDTGGVGYYVAQLGYGMFPWSALLPAALLLPSPRATSLQRDTVRLAALWFAATFTLFSLMVTKFHHYIFPAVPPAAVLVGLLLDRLLGAADTTTRPARHAASIAATALAVALGTYGLATVHDAWPRSIACLVLAAALMVASSRLARAPAASRFRAALGVVALSAAVFTASIARDLARSSGPRPLGEERLEHLFTYNYQRIFPTASFDFHPTLAAFGLIATLCMLALVPPSTRRRGAIALGSMAACFALWGLDRYMVDLSTHWSQRGLFERYTAMRADGDAPLAAYRMNWKGENFYTGNSAAMLECGLPLCERVTTAQWIAQHRGQRVFFVTERSHEPGLMGVLHREHGEAHDVTTVQDNAMFVLVEARL